MENITQIDLTPSGAESINRIYDGFDFNTVVEEIVSGKFTPQAQKVTERILNLVRGELSGSFALVGLLAALIVISAFINNLQESFGKDSICKATRFACYIYMTTVAVTAFDSACKYVGTTLSDITVLMNSIIPSMAMLYISGGGMLAGLTHPVIFFICGAFSSLIKGVITPLVLFRAATALLSGINENAGMNEFSDIFLRLHRIIISFAMTLFVGILGINKFAAASFDNLTARGIRFAVSTAVPIVGGSISEAMSSVAGSAILLKNAVGISGVIMLFAMFIVPLIKLFALSFAFRITGALAAPIADKQIADTLKKISECIDMLFASVACMGVTMIIAVASIM